MAIIATEVILAHLTKHVSWNKYFYLRGKKDLSSWMKLWVLSRFKFWASLTIWAAQVAVWWVDRWGGGGGLIHNKECEDEEVSFIEATRENQENIQRSIRGQMGQSGMLRLTKCLPLMGSKIIKNMKKKKKTSLQLFSIYSFDNNTWGHKGDTK